jgi:hypothetical protein
MAALTVLIVLLLTFRFLTTLPPPNLSNLVAVGTVWAGLMVPVVDGSPVSVAVR